MERLYRTQRGAMLVQVVVSGVAFAALAALAFDYGVKWIGRNQAQNAADSGALAGAVSLMLDGTDPSPAGPAKTAAQAFAVSNQVWRQGPIVDTFVMPPDPNTTGADCVSASPCMRVDVYRNQQRGNALPTFFGRLVGVVDQGVKATATAQVKTGNAVRCMLPFGVADRWADFYDDIIDTTYFPNDGMGVGLGPTPLPPGNAGWSPNDNYQTRNLPPGPGRDIYKSPVTYPTPGQHTGWTVQADYGRQLILKFGGTGTFSSGWASRLDLVGSVGGNEYRQDIENCNNFPISIAAQAETCNGYPNNTTTPDGGLHGCVSASTGVTQGPTVQGIGTVVGTDSGAYWSASAPAPTWLPGASGAVMNASGIDMDSPRIRPLVVFDINHYMAQNCSGTSCVAKVANIIGFFIEGMCTDVPLDPGNACEPPPDGNRDVVGRIVSLPSDYVTSVGNVADDAAFLRFVMLVR